MGVCILKNCKVIKLAEEVYSDLIIRQAAEDLFNNLDESCKKIIMDFDNIEFMSQSFAQEYVYRKKNTDIEIIEINMNEHVKKMFEIIYDRLEEAENKKRID